MKRNKTNTSLFRKQTTDVEIAKRIREIAGKYRPTTIANKVHCSIERVFKVASKHDINLDLRPDAVRPIRSDAEIADGIRSLVVDHTISAMVRELHIGKKALMRIAKAEGIDLSSKAKERDWRSPRGNREKARAVRECKRSQWEEFMLFGHVHQYTGWQLPATLGARR